MPRLRWSLAALLLLHLSTVSYSATLSCIPLSRLDASAPAGVQACCSEEWYTSYSGIKNVVPAGTARLYCGSPSDRSVDARLARTNTSWYDYCLDTSCPLEETEICCVTDTPVTNTTTIPASSSPLYYPSPTPSPPPQPKAAGSNLYPQQSAIWAIYMCPHTAPSTALFAFNLTPPTAAPPAAATAKAAPLNLTTAPAATLLSGCPSVPEGTAPPAYETTFNFTVPRLGSLDVGLSAGKPYMLSFLRKPSLGAVKVTLSVRLDDDQPDALIHDRVTLTLDAPTPSMVAAVPAAPGSNTGRRLLGSLVSEAQELESMQEARRQLLRAGGGGSGHGGGGGGSRGRSKSRSLDSAKYAGGRIQGPLAYNNETLKPQGLYYGEAFYGVRFSRYYAYRAPDTPYLASKRWTYPVPDAADPEDAIAYAVPALYAASYLVNTSVVNTTYGFYGPSVFRPTSNFHYVSNIRWPAPKGAPECTACASTSSCCSGGLSCCSSDLLIENSNWNTHFLQANRRATLLSCGLVQDYVTTLPIYLPTNATSLRITIHSIEAQATTAAPACGDTAATLDPRDPPFYVTVLRADKVLLFASRSPGSRSRSAATLAFQQPLLLALLAVVLSAWLLV